MHDSLLDHIFVTFVGRVFQASIGTSMGNNCTPLFADLLFYYYEADFSFVERMKRKHHFLVNICSG